MKNYWFIGDIHGEWRLLERLLEQVQRFEPEHILFVGDYIDRGPHSREVVELIMQMDVEVTCLMGNHEMMMLNAVEDLGIGYSPVELWYYNGGEATVQSFGATSFFNLRSALEPRYLKFFQSLKMNRVIEVGSHLKVLGTHAGISPSIPLEDQLNMEDYRDLNDYMMRNHVDPGESFLWIRDGFFNSPPTRWNDYLVVHGHTPTLKLKRFVSSDDRTDFLFVENDLGIRKVKSTGRILSIDIDSGSAISGRLSGLGFFLENSGGREEVRMQSLTVSSEDLVPRDLGIVPIINRRP
ncbi:MAG: metallophosphoesterase family protein [Bacteroidales bacterium]